jgi:hypothetical protein
LGAIALASVPVRAANQSGDDWDDPTQPPRQWGNKMNLPAPIERYVAAENSGDFSSLGEIFAPNATVHDEGRDYAGLEAIRGWMKSTKEKYGHRLEPLEATQRGRKSAVKIRLAGDFPGSPVTVQFVFALARGRIESLEVTS